MTPRTRRMTFIALIISIALPAWGQQYLLYSPQPVTSGQKAPAQDGVLVQEIEIQKGDTLSGLSRKFSGHGSYFPQILLFNTIKNPDLIYAGDTIRVPVSQNEVHGSDRTVSTPTKGVSRKSKPAGNTKSTLKTEPLKAEDRQSSGAVKASTPNTELMLSDLKPTGKSKSSTGRLKRKTVVQSNKKQTHEAPPEKSPSPMLKSSSPAVPAVDAAAGQKLFEAAVKAYRHDDCRTALELLDRYLADNSASPLAADANLYKAECYLKLSAQ